MPRKRNLKRVRGRSLAAPRPKKSPSDIKMIPGTVSREELERFRLEDEAAARSFDAKLHAADESGADHDGLYWEFMVPPQFVGCRGPRTDVFDTVSKLTPCCLIDSPYTLSLEFRTIGLLAAQNVPYECIDILDVMERAYKVTNLQVSSHPTPWRVDRVNLPMEPVLSLDADDLKMRRCAMYVELVRLMCACVRARHAYFRAGMRVSLPCLLSPDIQKEVVPFHTNRVKSWMEYDIQYEIDRIRGRGLTRMQTLRAEIRELEQDIAEDSELTCDVYMQRRLLDEVFSMRAETNLEVGRGFEWCRNGKLRFSQNAVSRVRGRLDPSCVVTCESRSDRGLPLDKLLSSETVSGLWQCLKKIWFLTEQKLSSDCVLDVDILESLLHVKHVLYSRDTVGSWYVLSGYPANSALMVECRQRFDIVQTYVGYLRARHVHVRAAVQLPSRLLSQADLTPEMLETRARIRGERQRDAGIRRKEADELEAGLRPDLAQHVMLMLLGWYNRFGKESIFERVPLSDDAFQLIMKALVNEGSGHREGICKIIQPAPPKKEQTDETLPDEAPPDEAPPSNIRRVGA